MLPPLILALDDFCANCGRSVDPPEILNPVTGWCDDCSPSIQVSNRVELSLAANAAAVEYYVTTQHVGVFRALALARRDRPLCLVCGSPMPHAPRTAIFCRKHKECRHYSRRYVYLYRERKPPLTKTEALAVVLSELTGE